MQKSGAAHPQGLNSRPPRHLSSLVTPGGHSVARLRHRLCPSLRRPLPLSVVVVVDLDDGLSRVQLRSGKPAQHSFFLPSLTIVVAVRRPSSVVVIVDTSLPPPEYCIQKSGAYTRKDAARVPRNTPPPSSRPAATLYPRCSTMRAYRTPRARRAFMLPHSGSTADGGRTTRLRSRMLQLLPSSSSVASAPNFCMQKLGARTHKPLPSTHWQAPRLSDATWLPKVPQPAPQSLHKAQRSTHCALVLFTVPLPLILASWLAARCTSALRSRGPTRRKGWEDARGWLRLDCMRGRWRAPCLSSSPVSSKRLAFAGREDGRRREYIVFGEYMRVNYNTRVKQQNW